MVNFDFMNQWNCRDDLYAKVVPAFSKEPEVREISIFGRNAEGSADQYSDLDIRILSNDPLATQQKYLGIFNTISPVIETLLLASGPDQIARMIMLKDYSPYQKIDFGILAGENTFLPAISVYQNHNALYKSTKMTVEAIPFDVNYHLTNYLFGVPRMTKCFFRRDFDMYRRWKGMTDALLVLLYEKYNGFEKETQKKELNAVEAKRLFSQLTSSDEILLDKTFPRNAALSIPNSFLQGLAFYITLSREKAEYFEATLNQEFINSIYTFAENECNQILPKF
jgi:hypothetical protein